MVYSFFIYLTCRLRRVKPDILAKYFLVCYVLVPIRNYRFNSKFADLDDKSLIEYSIHDTFDALIAQDMTAQFIKTCMDLIAKSRLQKKYEIVDLGVTILRTVQTKIDN